MSGGKSNREAAREVARRMASLREKGRLRLRRALAAAGALCFALLVCTAVLPNVGQADDELYTVPASSLTVAAGGDVGGYVLVGVLAFALGVTVVLLSLKWKKSRDDEDNEGGEGK